jgi:glycopeptide antibiotics resistance protein
MSTYYFSILTAAEIFLLVAFLASLPYAIISYRKNGYISVWKTIVLFSFVFYLLTAYFLTILPLPDPADVAKLTTARYDLTPFRFLQEIAAKSGLDLFDPRTWLPFLKSGYFLEPFFNFFLLTPFGIYLAYFKCGWRKVSLISFLLSLCFEISQLTGLFWIYSRPYRLFSTDDLILNTLGGLLGYFIFVKFLSFLPRLEREDLNKRERNRTVGYIRRTAAFLVDYEVVRIIHDFTGHFLKLPSLLSFAVVFAVYTAGAPLLTEGRTIGKALVWLKLHRTDGKENFRGAITVRNLLRCAVLTVVTALNDLVQEAYNSQIVFLLLFAAVIVTSCADMVYALAKKRRRLWYERLTHTENISTFRKNAKASSRNKNA